MTTPTLDVTVPADEPTIRFSRFLKAPPELVFACMTEAEHMRNWWGPRYLELTVAEIDLRVGGSYRFVHRAPDGTEHPFHGEFLELDPPTRLSWTFVYEPWPDAKSIDVIDLAAVEGGTMMSGTSTFDSVAARDRHVESGMEGGMRESYERLDELLASLTS